MAKAGSLPRAIPPLRKHQPQTTMPRKKKLRIVFRLEASVNHTIPRI
jgi:hypothetical protein